MGANIHAPVTQAYLHRDELTRIRWGVALDQTEVTTGGVKRGGEPQDDICRLRLGDDGNIATHGIHAPREGWTRRVGQHTLEERARARQQRQQTSGLTVFRVGNHQTVGLPLQITPPEPVVIWGTVTHGKQTRSAVSGGPNTHRH
jgi:hypothetical protein